MPASNHYHVLHRLPRRTDKPLPQSLEVQAQALVASGRLYINADTIRNFVHYTTASRSYSFSARELTHASLTIATKALIQQSIPRGLGAVAVNERLEQLHRELKKARGIDEALELRVARLVVQAAHPKVIATLLRERAQVFVSFSHTVGDLMPVHFWQDRGSAGGLQATEEDSAAVYISCGGDPFFDGKEEEKFYTTDGFDALARFMVIGGQELGHYADLIRTPSGITGRHSTHSMQPLRASAVCKTARDFDMAQVRKLQKSCANAGINTLLRVEDAVSFYEKQGQKLSALWCFAQMRRLLHWLRFTQRLPKQAALYTKTYPHFRCGQFYRNLLEDMAFNLAPDADVYKRPDPQEEEAIACIEALARVPQQAAKWGHAATRACWPKLYALYYGQVIGAL